MERPKLELNLNEPKAIKLLFDEAIVGESQYGKYYLYAVSNGNDKEFSFFAPDEVHSVLKDHKKGTVATITKVASQKGSKLVTSYKVEVESSSGVNSDDSDGSCLESSGMLNQKSPSNPYLDLMVQSFEDAIKIQEKFNGMANVNQISITMFIQRCKVIEFKK